MVVSVQVGVEQPEHAGVGGGEGGGEGGGGVHHVTHVRLDIFCFIILLVTILQARRTEYSRRCDCGPDGRDAHF